MTTVVENSHIFTLLDWNTNFDARALTGPFSWDARKEAVVRTILNSSTDFVCLQELRDDAVHYLASSALTAKYDMVVARTNATDMALCLVTMWNKRKWVCASRPLWFGPRGEMCDQWADCGSPRGVLPLHKLPAPGPEKPGDCGRGNGFGRVALMTEFWPAATPDPKTKTVTYMAEAPVCRIDRYTTAVMPLKILNVHLGLPEPERMLEAQEIHDRVEGYIKGMRMEMVVCGDFNSFPDSGGEKEVSVVTGNSTILYPVVGYGVPIPTMSVLTLTGTQISYPYDTYVKRVGDHEEVHPVEGEMGGMLDHVFHTAGIVCVDSILLTWRMDGKPANPEDFGYHKGDTAPRFPSDHLPWHVTFRTFDHMTAP